MKRKHYTGRRCNFEGLEQRRMMAGDVVVKMSGENLIINGNRFDNAITITAGLNPGQVIVSGITAGGAPTGINGTPNGSLTLNGFFGDLKVSMKSGIDSISINNVTVRGNTTIKTGSGIDNIAVLNTNSWGNTKVKSGSGSDTVAITGTTVAGKTAIKLGSGNDLLTVNTLATNKLKVSGGKGNDQVFLTNVTAAKAKLSGGTGVNKLSVTGSFLPKLTTKKFI